MAHSSLSEARRFSPTSRNETASGDPRASYLVNKLTGNGLCSGSRMPKTGAALSAAEIDTVRAWIAGL